MKRALAKMYFEYDKRVMERIVKALLGDAEESRGVEEHLGSVEEGSGGAV